MRYVKHGSVIKVLRQPEDYDLEKVTAFLVAHTDHLRSTVSCRLFCRAYRERFCWETAVARRVVYRLNIIPQILLGESVFRIGRRFSEADIPRHRGIGRSPGLAIPGVADESCHGRGGWRGGA